MSKVHSIGHWCLVIGHSFGILVLAFVIALLLLLQSLQRPPHMLNRSILDCDVEHGAAVEAGAERVAQKSFKAA